MSVVADTHREKLADTFATLFHMSFVELQDISTPQKVMSVLSEVLGGDEAKEILAKVCFTAGHCPDTDNCRLRPMRLRSF